MEFEITDKAAESILALKKDKPYLRIKVVGGGCSGLSYKLDFDSETSEKDHVIQKKNIDIVIDKKSFLFVAGTTLDFSDGLNGRGFEFHNPQAKKTCGCGSSFST